jgi:hypothetical protein
MAHIIAAMLCQGDPRPSSVAQGTGWLMDDFRFEALRHLQKLRMAFGSSSFFFRWLSPVKIERV